eukprot:5127965-Karenia_brevis.AAC.1
MRQVKWANQMFQKLTTPSSVIHKRRLQIRFSDVKDTAEASRKDVDDEFAAQVHMVCLTWDHNNLPTDDYCANCDSPFPPGVREDTTHSRSA